MVYKNKIRTLNKHRLIICSMLKSPFPPPSNIDYHNTFFFKTFYRSVNNCTRFIFGINLAQFITYIYCFRKIKRLSPCHFNERPVFKVDWSSSFKFKEYFSFSLLYREK